MSAQVELHPLGFIVRLDDGTLMPKMGPGKITVFGARHVANALAVAIDTDDMETAHDLIAKSGRVYMGLVQMLAADLKPGDVFEMRGVETVVLRDKEPTTDRFGLSLFRFWCQRRDTLEQGWCTFGPTGSVVAL